MSSVRVLAQSDPVPNLTARWAAYVKQAGDLVSELSAVLRDLDKTADQLAEHKVTVSVDLGPIGNAAASTRRDLEKRSDTPTFKMP
jgi:ABC-type phosphate/phosphonate transport system substrate-binding protein